MGLEEQTGRIWPDENFFHIMTSSHLENIYYGQSTSSNFNLFTLQQAVQVIQGPGKHPVTSVVVMAQPVFMVAGGVGGASSGSAGRQGPKVPQPLAPLVKYTGTSKRR